MVKNSFCIFSMALHRRELTVKFLKQGNENELNICFPERTSWSKQTFLFRWRSEISFKVNAPLVYKVGACEEESVIRTEAKLKRSEEEGGETDTALSVHVCLSQSASSEAAPKPAHGCEPGRCRETKTRTGTDKQINKRPEQRRGTSSQLRHQIIKIS